MKDITMDNKKTINLNKNTSKSNSIIEAAESFIKQFVSSQAPPMQKADMMLAFMAGAFSLYTIQMNPAFLGSSEKIAIVNMKKLTAEMEEFFASMANKSSTTFNQNITKDLG